MPLNLDDPDRDIGNAQDWAYDDNGVDRTQIRAMLALSPEQRLRRVEAFAEATMRIWAQNGVSPLR
jgi:hypothetical protein